MIRNFILVLLEPTGAIRTKILSKVIEFKEVSVGSDSAVLCPTQGFPIPKSRYFDYIDPILVLFLQIVLFLSGFFFHCKTDFKTLNE